MCSTPVASHSTTDAIAQDCNSLGTKTCRNVAYISGLDWLDGEPSPIETNDTLDDAVPNDARQHRLVLTYGVGVSDSRVTSLSIGAVARLFAERPIAPS